MEDLVGPREITPEVVRRARGVSLREPLLAGRLVARDGGAAGVNVRISLPGESGGELPATVEAVEELVESYRARYPDVELHTTGIVMINDAFASAPVRDAPTVMPLMLAVFVLAIVVFLRAAGPSVATLAVIVLSTLTAVGVAGHLGVSLDPTSASAPTIIVTLAVADSIHILVSFLQSLKEGKEKEAALVEAMEVNASPVFLTSVTTAIGFLTLNFSDSPPFRLLGNVTAFGVMAAWVWSMTVLPALVSLFPAAAGARRSGPLDRVVDRVSRLVRAKHRPVLAGIAAVAIGLSASIAGLRVDDQYAEYFSTALPFRQGTDFATEHLVGIYGATYSIDSGESQGVTDPDFLHRVDRFADWLEGRPDVVHVNSFSRIMKRLNRNMHGDDPAHHRIPDDPDLAAQYLLLYELSLPYGLDVNDQINVDRSSLRVDVTYGDIDVSALEEETAAAEAWLDRHGTPAMAEAEATGPALMFSKITRRNIRSMILGTGLGFLLIAGILSGALRSMRLGLLSLIPNLLPAAMAFGVWALLVGQVGFAVSVVAGLSIGIIVDDTVHFLSKYNRARGTSAPREAVAYAFRTVGTAILGNTVIVAAGFAVLGLSTFRVTAYMGLLTSLTILCALVVDFLLLPALLIELDRRPARREEGARARAPAEPVPAFGD